MEGYVGFLHNGGDDSYVVYSAIRIRQAADERLRPLVEQMTGCVRETPFCHHNRFQRI